MTQKNGSEAAYGWGGLSSYPRAILHVDGDSFFASCEVAKNPLLRGKCVITGKERGIVSAASYPAKAFGVKTGMRLTEAKKLCPEAIVLPSDYETYSLFSERMYRIVRRYTPAVEEYSIDECFAELTGLRSRLHMSYPEMAIAIKRDLETELGMTFSVGVSASKTLAKLGSKWNKPSGITMIPLRESGVFLEKTPIGNIWGIGPQTSALLKAYGIRTALDFAKKDEAWVRSKVSKPYVESWFELNGIVKNELDIEGRKSYQSISKTRTFTPASTDPAFILAQLSKNVENACIKARRWNLVAPRILFFLKTQDFRYHSCEVKLARATNLPHEILMAIRPHVPKVFKRRTEYRATGIVLCELAELTTQQFDLFGTVEKAEAVRAIYKSLDEMAEKFGKHTVFLGSSLNARKHATHEGERGDVAERTKNLFKGETKRQRLAIPMLGEVK